MAVIDSIEVMGRPINRHGSPQGHNPGPISDGGEPLFRGGIVTTFQSKDKVYTIETYRSGANRNGFLDGVDATAILNTTTGIYLNVHPGRHAVMSAERIMHSLSNPRTILELVRYEGVPVGYGIFPRFNIGLRGQQVEPVLYSSRAFLLEHTGGGIGTHVLAEAIRMHREELVRSHRQLRFGALMTQTPLSIVTLEKIPDVEDIFPFRRRFNENREVQSKMLGIHRAVYMHSLGIDTVTGVSRGELREIGMNDTWRPRADAGRVWEIYQEMISPPPVGLGMNREAGDVVYVLFRFRRPAIEIPIMSSAN